MNQPSRSSNLKRSAERHALIMSTLEAEEYVSIESMAELCGTSVQTIRRDFSELADKGQVVRYHGGARLPDPSEDSPSYENRNSTNSDAKAAASELLLNLIPDGATLFLAGGSTLAISARVLARRENLTIVTNNIHAAVTLYDRAGINVFVTGGWLRTASGSLIGDDAASAVDRFALDFAIVSASGISDQGDLLEFDETLAGPVRTMIKNARERILVIDSSKFAAKGIVRANHIREIGHLLTDRSPGEHMRAMIEGFGCELHVAR
ncbi:DeoR/GlpR family DNA-binding transcription regulator [Ochrobactrum teleogrylli]|uniref:DeoR/GlpR family DNA-binding transcription regulator n=1 Tax=Ochrobactrum teleogrylli TaxID=2479765 RepID=A0ABD5K0L1_9HYPH